MRPVFSDQVSSGGKSCFVGNSWDLVESFKASYFEISFGLFFNFFVKISSHKPNCEIKSIDFAKRAVINFCELKNWWLVNIVIYNKLQLIKLLVSQCKLTLSTFDQMTCLSVINYSNSDLKVIQFIKSCKTNRIFLTFLNETLWSKNHDLMTCWIYKCLIINWRYNMI